MANAAAIALAAIEQCQEPIIELHVFLEDHGPEELRMVDFYDEDGEIDVRYEFVRETPNNIFDDEGNFDKVAFDELEQRNRLPHGTQEPDDEDDDWYATDGLYWDDMRRVGESLPRRKEFLKEQIPKIVALATAVDRMRRLTPHAKRGMDHEGATDPITQLVKCPRRAE